MVFDSLQPATAFTFPDLGERVAVGGGEELLCSLTWARGRRPMTGSEGRMGKHLKEGVLNCQTCGNAGLNLLPVTLNLTGSPPIFSPTHSFSCPADCYIPFSVLFTWTFWSFYYWTLTISHIFKPHLLQLSEKCSSSLLYSCCLAKTNVKPNQNRQ